MSSLTWYKHHLQLPWKLLHHRPTSSPHKFISPSTCCSTTISPPNHQIALSLYHHQPGSHQQSFKKGLSVYSVNYREAIWPTADRTPQGHLGKKAKLCHCEDSSWQLKYLRWASSHPMLRASCFSAKSFLFLTRFYTTVQALVMLEFLGWNLFFRLLTSSITTSHFFTLSGPEKKGLTLRDF